MRCLECGSEAVTERPERTAQGYPGSFFALQLDQRGSGVGVYPVGTELKLNGEVVGTFVKRPEHLGYGSTYFALSIPTNHALVDAIAREAVARQSETEMRDNQDDGWPKAGATYSCIDL
jgi:hypothetical protein